MCVRKVFIDIGGWNGASVLFFRKYHPQGGEFEIYTFECDKKNIAEILRRKIPTNLFAAAAWVSTGRIRFYYSGSHTNAGGTMYPSKNTGGINPKNYYEVDSIDIADFIRKNFTDQDYIILKMNCEGSEYEIIPHLHKNGLIGWIDKWYVQWHYEKIGMSKEKHLAIAGMVPSWYEWDCQCHENSFKTKFLNSL